MEVLIAELMQSYAKASIEYRRYLNKSKAAVFKRKILVLISTSLNACMTVGFLGTIGASNEDTRELIAMIGVLFTAMGLGITFYTRDYDYKAIASKNRTVANDIWHIKEGYMALICDLREGTISDASARKRRDELTHDLYRAYGRSELTTDPGNVKLPRSILGHEELSISENDLKRFLPEKFFEVQTPHTKESEKSRRNVSGS